MNVPPFRLYGIHGCQFCQSADQFLLDSKVPYQVVVADKDPIVLLGAKEVLGSEPEFPILFSYVTNEVIKGFQKEQYERLVKVFRVMFGAAPANLPANEGVNPGEAAQVVTEPAPAPEGAAGVPAVSGDVDGVAGDAVAESLQ